MNDCVKLAKTTISQYLGITPITNFNPKKLQNKHSGCFVSLHTKSDGKLRGCIGTILPTRSNLIEEIKSNAISACNDPRFSPVERKEWKNLEVTVDLLSEPEAINSEKLLDPKKYGVIVKTTDGRTGLLLPDLEGINDANFQLAIARQKAGISSEEKVFLFRFTVERNKECK